jgi:hypothetical protein
MTISAKDAEILRDAHFLESEIESFANAVTSSGNPQPPINIESPIWQAVLTSRREWHDDKIQRGWTQEEIVAELENYYKRDKKRNPFDFIRAEYKPPKRKDYMEIARARQAAQIEQDVHSYYGRRQQKYERQNS